MSTKPAPFIWHDLMTTDVTAAKTFYAKVIGWTMQAFDSTNNYTVLTAGQTGVGGITAIPPEAGAKVMPPRWQGYIGVDDVDAYAKMVVAAGGAILKPPEEIPNVGRFAVAADPFGAAFNLFKPGSNEVIPPAKPGTQGLIGWYELHAGDGAKALEFYSKVFGWTKTRDMDMGPMGVYHLFATGAEEVGGIMTKFKDMPMTTWLYYFNVNGIDAAIARTNEAGGKVLMGPHEVPGSMWIAQCRDPQGAMFAMTSAAR